MKHEDILNTQLNVNEENTHKANSSAWIQTNEKFENGPIFIRGNDDTGYAATLGPYRVSGIMKTKDEVEEALVLRDYDILSNMIVTLTEIVAKQILTDIRQRKEDQENENEQEELNNTH